METVTKTLGIGVIAMGIVLMVALLISLPVMWLWNWLLPTIFGFKTITWTQALGLSVLSGLLFRSSSSSSKE